MKPTKDKIKFKPQKDFPFYQAYKDNFPITDLTIFVYKNTIFSNNTEEDWKGLYDILYHELKHIEQANKIGNDIWIHNYINNKDFRLEQEVEAYRYQLEKVKEMGDKQEYFNIYDECANNLSSKLYGSMVTKRKALELLRLN